MIRKSEIVSNVFSLSIYDVLESGFIIQTNQSNNNNLSLCGNGFFNTFLGLNSFIFSLK